MDARIKWSAITCILAMTGLMYGCGNNDSGQPKGQAGRLTQGPVKNATIFADNVSAGVRFTQDAGEISTTTDDNGDFTLPSVPGYNYILVSKGGTDKLTGQAAIQMIAPAGSANVTPLTTLVALDTTGTVKAKIEALMPAGVKYDTDISTTTSQAALMVSKSVEAIVQSMTDSVTDKAGENVISTTQISAIQAQMMQAIATEFAKPTVTTLLDPADLSTTLQTAATTAATNINTANPNITIPAGTATTLASSAVTATTTALNINATATTTAIAGGEAAAITPTAAQTFLSAVNTASATAVTSIIASTTLPNYTPPTIQVVTPVTVPSVNATGTTGGSSGGTGITF